MTTRPNIIVFGETGAGKSSVVNMLSASENVAEVSSKAKGCTFQSHSYTVGISGRLMTLWDTAGLNEGDAGKVPKSDAVVQLYSLLRSLSDGVSLLMFVMRAPRIKSSVPENWKLFHEIICQEKVPIVIVITGLEQEDDMDTWWWDNEVTFEKYGIKPAGFACITGTKGKRNLFQMEYKASQARVRDLIRSTALTTPWRVPAAEWFKTVVHTIYSTKNLGCSKGKRTVVERREYQQVAGEAFDKLIKTCGMSEEVARDLAKKMKDSDNA